jgi:hypothetical protein
MDKKFVTISLIFLFLVSGLAYPASAINLNPIDAGSQMIANGIDSWTVNFGDKLMNASNYNNESSTNHVIFSILLFNPDPFTNPWVQETRDTTALIYTILVLIFMFGGAAYVYLHTASPSVAKNIDFLVGGNLKYFHLNNYLKNLVMAIVMVAVVYLGYWLLLLFNSLLSELVLSYTLDSVIPKPDNFVMYLLMAWCAFSLSLFMAWRILVIGWGAAYVMVLAGMYLFSSLRSIAVKIFMYIVIMIFMQVILLSIAGAGVMIIQWLPGPEVTKFIFYSALTSGLTLLALVLVIGSTIFLFFMREGGKVIKLVM